MQHADSERQLGRLDNRIEILSTAHDKHISGLDSKIDKEIAKLLATYERYRNDVIKYAAGEFSKCQEQQMQTVTVLSNNNYLHPSITAFDRLKNQFVCMSVSQ